MISYFVKEQSYSLDVPFWSTFSSELDAMALKENDYLLKGVSNVSAKAAPSQAGSDQSQPRAVPAVPGFIGAIIDVDAGVSCLVLRFLS